MHRLARPKRPTVRLSARVAALTVACAVVVTGCAAPGADSGTEGPAESSPSLAATDVAVAATVVNVSTAPQLEQAVADANSAGGDRTIVLADGTYTVSDTLYVNAPGVTLRSQSGNRSAVIVQGDAMSYSADVGNLIRVSDDDFRVQDLTLQRCGNHLVQVAGEEGADGAVMSNVIFRDANEQMVKGSAVIGGPVEGSDDGLVENCLFEYTAGIGPQYYIGGIDVHEGSGWVVRGNTFRDIASPSSEVAEHAVHFWTLSADTIVEDNVIVDCDRGVGFGLMEGRGHTGGIIRNNMIYHSDNGDPFADVGIALAESPGTLVYNNTVIQEHDFPWTIEHRWSNTGASIRNNLTNGESRSRDGGDAAVSDNVTTAQTSWFVDAAAGDLHVIENASTLASVIDQGAALAEVTDDIDGHARPQGSAYDVGADETGLPIPFGHIERLWGADRFATAVAIAREGWGGGSGADWGGVTDVVLACGDDRAASDPLAGAGLTWAYDAPMLLVSERYVPSGVLRLFDEMADDNAGTPIEVHVVGGPAALPDARLDEIQAHVGASRVTMDRLRRTGDRYDMARAIAQRVREANGDAAPVVTFVANGTNPTNFVDALALSAVTAANGYPIVLVAKDGVPSASQSAIDEIGSPRLIVGGGPAAVSNSVQLSLGAERWYGSDRYETASRIARNALDEDMLEPVYIGVAAALPDALSGGAMVGSMDGPLLLTGSTTLSDVTAASIEAERGTIDTAYVFGGVAVVEPVVVGQLASRLR